MTVYTLEVEREFEEDFGSWQFHFLLEVLEGVFNTYEEAEEYGRMSGQDFRIKSWDI